ncbi:TetR/AcrR family transcriptional regulator [Actinocatenispora rupis]|uniref:TetR family transcriptional regulator n=1 Tax=Actinocatenispora rupis TaxID=519421 RepID=A0A8J3IWE4_9ACTN|nr:TetR/AcrR family transcriptional regulator [Actinocatenispora rupis]GID09893.1 TetR family transcriptional regulator [Actinocatenispora rupis]
MSPSDPAPTRRRERLGEERRRAQIVRATLEVVAHHGYEYASLARIADAAGVSKGLVSHYFGSKDDLMATVARGTLAALRDSLAAGLDLTRPVPDVLRAALRQAARLGQTHATEFRALNRISLNLRGPDEAPRLTLADYEETYRAEEALLRRGQEEGTLRDFDVRVVAVTYQGAIDAMLAYLDEHPDVDPDRYADTLAELLLAGIAVRR